MDSLRQFVARAVTSTLVTLLVVDAVDAIVGTNRYEVPTELYWVVGTIVGGLFAVEALSKRGNGKGKADG